MKIAGLSAHALQASAYVAAKFSMPNRALPLLEAALLKAQADYNWGLEQLCRAGIGAVLRQLGRYRESIDQLRFALALARKTLDPSAEASRLMDMAIAEVALGNYEAAAAGYTQAAAVEKRSPTTVTRAYIASNRGELALLTGRISVAEECFHDAYDFSLLVELWPIQTTACAGLALCAQRTGKFSELVELSASLRTLIEGRETLQHDRWMLVAATTWSEVVQSSDAAAAIRNLEATCRELSRRDIDHWLCLELEAIRIKEYIDGCRATALRSRLAQLSTRYDARGILSAAQAPAAGAAQ
jgi:tetratricopeptide (TPR) repeat protein